MKASLVRIFATYGPMWRSNTIPRIPVENIVNEKSISKFGDDTVTCTWIFISDIISAFLVVLSDP